MKLPDRWMDYSNTGQVVVGTPFVAFKTPLSKNYDGKLPVDQRFSPSMLPELHQNLSVVIDLTATNRYYNSVEIEDLGMDYIKIKVPGKIVPPPELVARFFEVADNYRAIIQNGPKDSLIGVHCTHGLNRTGYFVCRYLIERMGFSPEDAIERFEQARGHSMERANYIESLKSCTPSLHPPKAQHSKRNTTHNLPPFTGCNNMAEMHNYGRGRSFMPSPYAPRNRDDEIWYLDRFSPEEPWNTGRGSVEGWSPERFPPRNREMWNRSDRNTSRWESQRPFPNERRNRSRSPRHGSNWNPETRNHGSRSKNNGFRPSSQNRGKHEDYARYSYRKREEPQ